MAFSFGATPAAAPAFGAPAAAPKPAFGAAPAPAPGGLFGSTPAPAPAAGGLFGSTPAPAPAAGGLFGSTPAPAPAGGGLFGSTPAPAPGGLFGAKAPTPSGFGAPAPAPGGLFGAPAPAPGGLFGAPAPAPGGLFGAPAPAPGGLFGAPAPAPSAFGAPATAPPAAANLAGYMPYSSLPQDQKNNIDTVYQAIMSHKRTVLAVSTMAPKLLDTSTQQADVAGGGAGQEVPLSVTVQRLNGQVQQLEHQIKSLHCSMMHTKQRYETSTTQAIRDAKWPTEFVATRVGVTLNNNTNTNNNTATDATKAASGAPATKENKKKTEEFNRHLKELLDREMTHADQIYRMPSPYLWQCVEEMEGRSRILQGQLRKLKETLDISNQISAEEPFDVVGVIKRQEDTIWKVANDLMRVNAKMNELRQLYNLHEKGMNVLEEARQREEQHQRKVDEQLRMVMVKTLPSTVAPAAAAPAPGGSLFGAPAPAGGSLFGTPAPAPAGGSLFGTPAPAPAGGSLFGTPAPAPAGGSLFGKSPAPAPGGLFGAPAPAGGGLFGSTTPAPAPAGGGLFGSTAPAPAPAGGGLFGSTPAPAPAFGAPAPAPAAPAFGATPAPAFGAPAPASGNLFGLSTAAATPKSKSKRNSSSRRR